MTIVATRHAALPTLAWLARVRSGTNSDIELHHGCGVEVGDDWYFEGTWHGDYGERRFDETDVVAGSGGRIRDDGFCFVSSGDPINRLHYSEFEQESYISNSLPFLLAGAGLNLRLDYGGYHRDLFSVTRGLNKYKRTLVVQNANANLLYYENLLWTGKSFRVIEKPRVPRDFTSYAKYKKFLTESVEQLAINGADPARTFPYEPLGTLSGGYDSPAVMAIAKQVGCSQAVHFSSPQETADSIAPVIAERMGVTLHQFDMDAWRTRGGSPETSYIVGVPEAEEVRFESASSILTNKLLLTGIYGDIAWDAKYSEIESDFERIETQGLSYCEKRLWDGYQVLPIPMLGGLQLREIQAIGRHEDMNPWRIGGEYDRPIPRRMIEEAGIPRGLFATSKAGQSLYLPLQKEFLSKDARIEFASWLEKHSHELPRYFGLRPTIRFDSQFFFLSSRIRQCLGRLPFFWRVSRWWRVPSPCRLFLFQWATEILQTAYRSALSDSKRKSKRRKDHNRTCV